MAVNAYILINVEPERIPEVVERLRAIPGGIVREVIGPYDVVVELEEDTEEDLTRILRHDISPISGITALQPVLGLLKMLVVWGKGVVEVSEMVAGGLYLRLYSWGS
jgi:DNA-binding Lrp family transcriptional regulator